MRTGLIPRNRGAATAGEIHYLNISSVEKSPRMVRNPSETLRTTAKPVFPTAGFSRRCRQHFKPSFGMLSRLYLRSMLGV